MAVVNSFRLLLRAPLHLRQTCRYSSLALHTPPFKITLQNLQNTSKNITLLQNNLKASNCYFVRHYARPSDNDDDKASTPQQNLTLFQRFKQMYRDYWYVLVPVHLVTSAFWFGGFYYLAKSGIDIVAIMESWNISERITNSLKDSSMGYIAVSYALYKIATPLRYTVTLGGTTISIKYLKEWGYIKPVPNTQQLKEMYELKRNNIIESMKEKREIYKEHKDNIQQKMKDTKEEIMMKKQELKSKTDGIMDDFENTLQNIKKETKNLKVEAQKAAPVIRDLKGKSKNT